MPALPVVNKVLRVDLRFTIGVQLGVMNHLFFAFAGAGPTIPDLTTWTSTIITAWGANMSAQQHTSAVLTSVTATDLTSPTGAQYIASAAVPGTQTGTGSAPSSDQAALILFKISRRYRGGHPRIYMVGPSMAHLSDSNNWQTTYCNSIAAAFLAFINAVKTTPPASIGAIAHLNVSYYQGFTNKTYPSGRTYPVPTLRGTPVQDAVLSYVVPTRVANQRKRLM